MTNLMVAIIAVVFGAPILVMILGLATWTEVKAQEIDLETEEDFIKN